MNIAVCIKQIPAADEIEFDERGNLMRDGAASVLNPCDEFALEAALRLKDENPGTEVFALSMGPAQAAEILRYAVSKGADAGFLLCDTAFKGADTLATAHALSAGLKKIHALKPLSLVLCGARSEDSDTAQVPPQVAALLNWPDAAQLTGLAVSAGAVSAQRTLGRRLESISIPFPALLSVAEHANIPRLPSIKGKLRSKSASIAVWSCADIGLEAAKAGIAGSPTVVERCFPPDKPKKAGLSVTGAGAAGKARALALLLHERGLL